MAALALCALASTFVLPLSHPDFTGWRLDHGHMTLAGTPGGAVPHHVHAWERHVEGVTLEFGARAHHAHDADDGAGEGGRVVTTNGDLGSMPGVGVAWAPAPVVVAAVAARAFEGAATPSRVAAAMSPPPLTPPPRV